VISGWAHAFRRTLEKRIEALPLNEATLDRAVAGAMRYPPSHWAPRADREWPVIDCESVPVTPREADCP
jgi:hypothetical protein